MGDRRPIGRWKGRETHSNARVMTKEIGDALNILHQGVKP